MYGLKKAANVKIIWNVFCNQFSVNQLILAALNWSYIRVPKDSCSPCRVTLGGLWCVRGPQAGSSWLAWWVGVSAAPRSTDLGFIPVSPSSATGFLATQIPAWSMNTPPMFPLCQLLWQEEVLTIRQCPGPLPWTYGLHQHHLVIKGNRS